MKVAENFGRLFEVGFNIGILSAISEAEISHNFGDLYSRDLQKLRFPEMLRKIIKDENITDEEAIRNNLEKWGLFLIQKGWLSGLNFFREYLKSLGKDYHKSHHKYEIIYNQCSFSDDNSLNLYPKDKQLQIDQWLSQLKDEFSPPKPKINWDKYSGKGEFFKADTLMLLRYRNKLRILVVDLSIFSVKAIEDLIDLTDKNLDNQRRLLKREINYLKSKSVFVKLRLDTGDSENLDVEFSEDLKRYFTAFKRQDKECVKLIQAASYAYSFYGFLQQFGVVKPDNSTMINVVGYSDRNLSNLSLNPQNPHHWDLLATCANIYQNESKDAEITTARKQVMDLIRRNVAKSFKNGKSFLENLSNISRDRLNIIPPHTEIIDDFSCTLDLRQPHAEAVQKSLNSDYTYIFLTGNPGIGKTTAIVDFLKSHIDEGFLFFYVSPRKQVNLDIIEKFKNSETDNLSDDRLFCVTTNSTLLRNNAPSLTVNYLATQHQNEFNIHSVKFLPINHIENTHSSHGSPLVNRFADNRLKPSKNKVPGVLSTLCEAISNLINDNSYNHILAIVATACIQSLRMTNTGKNTLENFEKIFQKAYSKKKNEVDSQKMQSLSKRIKNIFIMIDEITGDNTGVEFLDGIRKIIEKYELTNPEYGFNTKVIVADASIVDSEVITQHLSETSPEPDKIFFRRVSQPDLDSISSKEFEFNRKSAIAINANSYPAKGLTITYKPFIESVQFNQDQLSQTKEKLPETVLSEIFADIDRLIQEPNTGQILVYIQDKIRLKRLIEDIQKQQTFVKNQDYLEVHANLSDTERQEIHQYQNQVKVVFMTSSASRGLSFPKSTHILVEVPRFQVETNLMEIIQVIYRCRGQFWEEGKLQTFDDHQKFLTFYLCDRAVYYGDDSDPNLSIQESLISMLNLLVILKTAIMTRIQGYGQVGRGNFLMIPIGGKSVSASGQSFTGQLSTLIKELYKESKRHPQNTTLTAVYMGLKELLIQCEFWLNSDDYKSSSKSDNISYLKLIPEFNAEFAKYCDPLTGLLDLKTPELAHICGSLILVNISSDLAESYQIRLAKILQSEEEKLLKKMIAIRDSSQYPPSLTASIKGAIDLIYKLQEHHDRTQTLEQQNSWDFQYYAIPLFTFIVGDQIRNYFQSQIPETENDSFRRILSQYVNVLYPCEQVLPIGDRYQEFPFVIFRSYSLEQMRSKVFSDRYLLTSTELNILNLILSQHDN
ncbi:MAG: helicase-related protein [Arthrospira platensis PCC 7345]|uniref:helicase-related protein n=1 Tax=Limnospira platensis TaxID=118562 RepID=UPI0028E0A9F5|nr:helicase-related protein [Arthrospira platensis PCC 7345]